MPQISITPYFSILCSSNEVKPFVSRWRLTLKVCHLEPQITLSLPSWNYDATPGQRKGFSRENRPGNSRYQAISLIIRYPLPCVCVCVCVSKSVIHDGGHCISCRSLWLRIIWRHSSRIFYKNNGHFWNVANECVCLVRGTLCEKFSKI